MPRAVVLLISSLGGSAAAAEPGVRGLDIRGLQVGGTTAIVVDGDALGTTPRLLLPFPAKQTLRPKGTDTRAAFEVVLDADVPPGYAHLRVAAAGGVSPPVIVGVDRLPQRPFAAAAGSLPVALHGLASGSGINETTFAGKRGETVFLEVEAQRLGGKLRPVLHLYGPNRLQLGWSWPTPTHAGDTRLEAALPADGTYTITLHDSEYAAPAGSSFRLKIGRWDAVDAVFPPAGGVGTRAVELLGPGRTTRVDLPGPTSGGLAIIPWPKGGTWTGPRPWVALTGRPELLEEAATGKPQDLPEGAVGVSGKLLLPYEEDRYRVPVRPGGKVKFEVFAERLGSPLDVALVVRDGAGAVLARAEDGPGTLDPVLEYDVPARAAAVVVCVVDSQGRGGPRGIYRLAVDPAKGAGDFALTTTAQRVGVPAGGRVVVPVLADRKGYDGPIELSAEGLPAGVALENATVPAGADGALVEVRHSGMAGEAAVSTWHGRGDPGIKRAVAMKGHPLERLQPWLASELAVAVTPAAMEAFAVEWRGLSADAELVPGGKLALPVKLVRPKANTVVRLTLITSQFVRLANGVPNPMQTLRAESATPLELPATATEGALPIVVPALLPGTLYDLAVQADLLSADKKAVLATAYTPVRRMKVRPPSKKK